MATDSLIPAFVLPSLIKLAGLLGAFSVSYLWYRLISHSLRKFPGPLAAKFTSAYGTKFIWQRDFHLKAMEWHANYGSVVRVAPNRLIFNSATALHDIYNNSNVTKGKAYVQLRQDTNGAGNLLNTLEREPHRQKRRIIAPVVSERSMRIFEPQMLQEIESFLAQLLRSSREKEAVNMSHRCEWLGVDVVGQLAFGYSLNTQSDPLHRAMVDGIKARGDTGSLYFFWSWMRNFDWIFNKLSRSGRTEGLYRSLKMIIGARMKIPKDAKHDFFSMASGDMNSKEPGIIGMEFWAEAILFIAAGGTTTATAMSGAFFYLSRNSAAYQRLAAEIRNTFSSGQDIRQGPKLSQCKYLRAVIEETMRMSPSALAIAWREQYPESVAAGESFIVDGHVIPPGTQVGVSNYCLQHDPSIFKEPFSFRPERWLLPDSKDSEGTDQSESYAAMRYAFAPFSLGDRGCAGKPMAYLEMSLVIAKVMWYFDFERATGAIGDLGGGTVGRKDGRGRADEFQLYEGVVVGHYGPNLMFTSRDEYYMEIQAKEVD